jgi:hypothetical protein
MKNSSGTTQSTSVTGTGTVLVYPASNNTTTSARTATLTVAGTIETSKSTAISLSQAAMLTVSATVTPTSSGTVKINDGTASATPSTTFHSGASVKFQAVPATGYEFVKWSNNSTTNPLTLTNQTASVSLTATFEQTIVNNDGTPPYILYWDSSTSTMQVGAWGGALTASNYASKMLFFKFGGVVGFTNGETWNTSTSIKFNPVVGTTITGYGTDYATSALPSIPSFTTTDYNNGIRDVSGSNYHTLANVKAGKGDPCKLVGLTVAQIQSGVIDNGLYRLPTNAENVAFFGSSSGSNEATYSTWTANQANEASPGTRTFLKSDPANAVLPAAGYRDYSSGGVYNRGTYGYYWSSTPDSSAYGYFLCFNSGNVGPSDTSGYGVGVAVRCAAK